jgi:hypothetical protein
MNGAVRPSPGGVCTAAKPVGNDDAPVGQASIDTSPVDCKTLPTTVPLPVPADWLRSKEPLAVEA